MALVQSVIPDGRFTFVGIFGSEISHVHGTRIISL